MKEHAAQSTGRSLDEIRPITERIIEMIRNKSPPGRFLDKDDTGLWKVVDEARVLEKVKQAIQGSIRDAKKSSSSSLRDVVPVGDSNAESLSGNIDLATETSQADNSKADKQSFKVSVRVGDKKGDLGVCQLPLKLCQDSDAQTISIHSNVDKSIAERLQCNSASHFDVQNRHDETNNFPSSVLKESAKTHKRGETSFSTQERPTQSRRLSSHQFVSSPSIGDSELKDSSDVITKKPITASSETDNDQEMIDSVEDIFDDNDRDTNECAKSVDVVSRTKPNATRCGTSSSTDPTRGSSVSASNDDLSLASPLSDPSSQKVLRVTSSKKSHSSSTNFDPSANNGQLISLEQNQTNNLPFPIGSSVWTSRTNQEYDAQSYQSGKVTGVLLDIRSCEIFYNVLLDSGNETTVGANGLAYAPSCAVYYSPTAQFDRDSCQKAEIILCRTMPARHNENLAHTALLQHLRLAEATNGNNDCTKYIFDCVNNLEKVPIDHLILELTEIEHTLSSVSKLTATIFNEAAPKATKLLAKWLQIKNAPHFYYTIKISIGVGRFKLIEDIPAVFIHNREK